MARAIRSDSPQTALLLCDQILVSDPAHLPAIELKVKSQWRLGLYEPALEGLSQALALNPYDPGYHFLRGDCCQNLLRYGEALDAFERCRLGDDPELAAQAEIRLKGLEDWQSTLLDELARCEPNLVHQMNADPTTLRDYGFRPRQAEMTESVRTKLASATIWARPS